MKPLKKKNKNNINNNVVYNYHPYLKDKEISQTGYTFHNYNIEDLYKNEKDINYNIRYNSEYNFYSKNNKKHKNLSYTKNNNNYRTNSQKKIIKPKVINVDNNMESDKSLLNDN